MCRSIQRKPSSTGIYLLGTVYSNVFLSESPVDLEITPASVNDGDIAPLLVKFRGEGIGDIFNGVSGTIAVNQKGCRKSVASRTDAEFELKLRSTTP